ncbi:DUF1572 family protein [Flavobacteriaceae bacterium M23B6Z8]
MSTDYLESVQKQLAYYKSLGDKTFEQLSDEQLFWKYDKHSNSIAVIVKHLWGNMQSRWTDFLIADGEKEWRKRDDEFEADIKNRAELLGKWNEGWSTLFKALGQINESNFDTIIYIRNMGHTITEAVNRQLGHYSYHVGQIVFIGRMLAGDSWKSLSIPRGKSKNYNSEKFSKPKRRAHFTDDFLDGKDFNTEK